MFNTAHWLAFSAGKSAAASGSACLQLAEADCCFMRRAVALERATVLRTYEDALSANLVQRHERLQQDAWIVLSLVYGGWPTV